MITMKQTKLLISKLSMISFVKLVSTVNVRVISQVDQDQVMILVIQADLATIQVTQVDQAGLQVLQAQVLALLVHLTRVQATTHQALAHLALTTIHLVRELVDQTTAQAALINRQT